MLEVRGDIDSAKSEAARMAKILAAVIHAFLPRGFGFALVITQELAEGREEIIVTDGDHDQVAGTLHRLAERIEKEWTARAH
jgi:selenocysteine lyase/cysteine desulfurase